MTILMKNDHLDQKYTFGQKMIILTKIDFFHPAFWSKMTVFKQNKHFLGGGGVAVTFYVKKSPCRTIFFTKFTKYKS